jgi:hypothetical protein
MKCDICGQVVENSEELEKHREQVHATGMTDKPAENLEQPDLLGNTPDESSAREIPKANH